MVETIQTIYEKKVRNRYWTTNLGRNNDRNRMEYSRRKDKKISLGAGTGSNTQNNAIRIPNLTGQY